MQGAGNYWWALTRGISQQKSCYCQSNERLQCFHWQTHELALNPRISVRHVSPAGHGIWLFIYLSVVCLSEVFSYMKRRSITDLNECRVTGGTAIFTQIHSDGHSSWECHQRSVGWPAWVLICLFCISCFPIILRYITTTFHVNVRGRYMYVCVILANQNVLRSMSATLFNMCVCSGHSGPIRGTVHPNSARKQKKDQAHRQWHQPKMEWDLQLHIGPQPTERPGG